MRPIYRGRVLLSLKTEIDDEVGFSGNGVETEPAAPIIEVNITINEIFCYSFFFISFEHEPDAKLHAMMAHCVRRSGVDQTTTNIIVIALFFTLVRSIDINEAGVQKNMQIYCFST